MANKLIQQLFQAAVTPSAAELVKGLQNSTQIQLRPIPRQEPLEGSREPVLVTRPCTPLTDNTEQKEPDVKTQAAGTHSHKTETSHQPG